MATATDLNRVNVPQRIILKPLHDFFFSQTVNNLSHAIYIMVMVVIYTSCVLFSLARPPVHTDVPR